MRRYCQVKSTVLKKSGGGFEIAIVLRTGETRGQVQGDTLIFT
jgi:hypothetical protein